MERLTNIEKEKGYVIHIQLKFEIFKNNTTPKFQSPGIAYQVASFV